MHHHGAHDVHGMIPSADDYLKRVKVDIWVTGGQFAVCARIIRYYPV